MNPSRNVKYFISPKQAVALVRRFIPGVALFNCKVECFGVGNYIRHCCSKAIWDSDSCIAYHIFNTLLISAKNRNLHEPTDIRMRMIDNVISNFIK